ncbi:unnamed protein product [Linum trigynum]|uniref:Uncharacterized protein n=1 Tax=Linum trigynum TaxID=586398 RepID=A0AAV2D525_9ROSI
MYDMGWTIKGPRCKRSRNRGPNVKESRQAREQEGKIPMKDLKMNQPTSEDCIQRCQQHQGQGSSQPEETSVEVLTERLPSLHEKELQNHGKALPVKLALEPSTGRIIYLQNPRKQQGQVQGKGGHVNDQTSNDFCDMRTCLEVRT